MIQRIYQSEPAWFLYGIPLILYEMKVRLSGNTTREIEYSCFRVAMMLQDLLGGSKVFFALLNNTMLSYVGRLTQRAYLDLLNRLIMTSWLPLLACSPISLPLRNHQLYHLRKPVRIYLV